jgi:hypothetical protein
MLSQMRSRQRAIPARRFQPPGRSRHSSDRPRERHDPPAAAVRETACDPDAYASGFSRMVSSETSASDHKPTLHERKQAIRHQQADGETIADLDLTRYDHSSDQRIFQLIHRQRK